MLKNQNKAQGTIEYLVIIGIVVVLSLVIVGFVLTQTNTTGDVSNNFNQLSSATNQLAIKETVIGTDGNGLLVIQNNSPDTIILNKIVSGPITLTYDQTIVQGNTNNIALDLLAQTCVCGANDKTKNCLIEITYTTQLGITKKQIQNITLNCVTTFSPAQTTNQPTQIITTTNCFDVTQEPIPLCTISDLNRVRDYLDRNFILRTDINAAETTTWNSGAGFDPIATPAYCLHDGCPEGWWCTEFNCQWANPAGVWVPAETFDGYFNGQGKTILNLTINKPSSSYVGLFSKITNTISNLGMIDSNIVGYQYVGGITGQCNGTITNSYNTGDLNGIATNTGGITGYLESGTITDSYNTGIIVGGGTVGGIAGNNSSGTITNTYNTGDINGTGSIGGIIGYSTGSITNSYNTGNLNATSEYVGGITGYLAGNLTNSYNTGNINGTSYTGGLVGRQASGTITDSYSTGNIVGTTNTERLLGFFAGTITNSYFDYENASINGENSSGPFGLNTTIFNYWLNNNKQLPSADEYFSKDGDVYLIQDIDDFKQLTSFGQEAGRKFRLENNLDFVEEDNAYIPTFASDFNGNNKTISNITINLPTTNNVGLFGYSTGNISNLGLIDSNIVGYSYVGGITGYTTGSISNSYNVGNVTGLYNLFNYVGGITGYATGNITNTYMSGNATGYNYVGGISGYITGNTTNSYANITLRGNGNVGGIAGANYGTITNTYTTGRITITSTAAGGIVGQNNGTITKSYSLSDVNANGSVGGIVGNSGSSGKIKNNFSIGDVNGLSYVGGIAGSSQTSTTGDVNMNYSISRVTRTSGAATTVRGFAGLTKNAASVSYANWSPTLSTYSTCRRTGETWSNSDSNTGCTAITSTATNFYGAAGIPFANLLFDGNWTARDGNYPILTWQTQ